MGVSVVERAAVSGVSPGFARWLAGELETVSLVAAPEGVRELLLFGAVRTVGREVELTWSRFTDNPVRVVGGLLRGAAGVSRPVVVAERRGLWVWLAVGSHCAAGTADAVILG